MKKALLPAVFFGCLLLIFFFEGLGFKNGREISYYLILILPFLIFSLDIIRGKEIVIPKKIAFMFLIFFIFTLISTAQAVNIQRSFEYSLYLLSVFLISVFVFNHKKEIGKPLIIFMIVLAFIFSFYSFFINYLLPPNLSFLVPKRGYQYVFSYYKTHNPLGPLILPVLILCLSQFINKKRQIFFGLFLVLLPLFLQAYSRSAYLAFIITGILMTGYYLKTNKLRILSLPLLLITTVGLTSSVLFFATTNIGPKIPIISETRQILKERLSLQPKPFFGNRDAYYRQALLSIKEKPFLGVGPFNFWYASRKYATQSLSRAETSDNVFLEMFSENGIIAGAVFILIIVLVILNFIKRHDKKDHFISWFFVFLSVLIMYQTDSSQRNYSHFLLFFVILGLIYEERLHFRGQTIILVLSGLLVFMSSLIIFSQIFFKQNSYQKALYFYPLNYNIYQPLIDQERKKGNYKNVVWFMKLSEKFFYQDFDVLYHISTIYKNYGEINLSRHYFNKAQQLTNSPD